MKLSTLLQIIYAIAAGFLFGAWYWLLNDHPLLSLADSAMAIVLSGLALYIIKKVCR